MSNDHCKIIAVGYELSLSDIKESLLIEIEKKDPLFNRKNYTILDTVKAGVFYDISCPGNLGDACSDQSNMIAWYSTKKDIAKFLYCKKVYVAPKLIIGEVYIANDKFFVVLSNMTKGIATTMHKKAIIAGVKTYKPFDIERITIPAIAYKYEH